jgi:MFS family permease
MNAHAVEVEKAYGRPIFSAFHAFWSLGGVIGAAVGGAALAAGLPMVVTLSSLGIFCGVIALLLNAWLLDNPKIAENKEKNAAISKEEQKAVKKEQSKANRPFMKLVIALGIMAGSGALIEGIGIDWSALFAVDVLNATVSQAAFFVMFFSGAMASFRLVADKVVAKVGRLNVIRYGSAISALGVAFALAQTSIPVSIAGWFIFAYSAEVGEESHSGRNMAIVFGLCYAGMLGGPAVIGWVANLAPLGTALIFGSLLGAFIFAASWFLPKPKQL